MATDGGKRLLEPVHDLDKIHVHGKFESNVAGKSSHVQLVPTSVPLRSSLA